MSNKYNLPPGSMEYRKAYYEENKDRYAAYQRRWRARKRAKALEEGWKPKPRGRPAKPIGEIESEAEMALERARELADTFQAEAAPPNSAVSAASPDSFESVSQQKLNQILASGDDWVIKAAEAKNMTPLEYVEWNAAEAKRRTSKEEEDDNNPR